MLAGRAAQVVDPASHASGLPAVQGCSPAPGPAPAATHAAVAASSHRSTSVMSLGATVPTRRPPSITTHWFSPRPGSGASASDAGSAGTSAHASDQLVEVPDWWVGGCQPGSTSPSRLAWLSPL